MAKITFDTALAGMETIEIDVETGNGNVLTFAFRVPSLAEALELDRSMPAQPQPEILEYKRLDDRVLPVYDDQSPAYINRLINWRLDLQHRQIVAWWATDIPGDTAEEKVESLRKLTPEVVKAAGVCARYVSGMGEVRIKDRPFHGTANAHDAPVLPDAVDA